MIDTRVLILGGTAEARSLAAALDAADVSCTSSLAGRVSQPRLPVGPVRIGGFGGVDGLATHLTQESFTHLVDATHPFAVGMRRNAVAAARRVGCPVVRLARPGWSTRPEAATWHWVADHAEAATVAATLGARPFLTSGRQTLGSYARLRELPCLVRVVEPLADGLAAPSWTIVLDRGPFGIAGEIALMSEHGVDVLVTKDSGGSYTSAKLDAARALGVPVVVVTRPPAPEGLDEVSDPQAVLDWLQRTAG